MSDKKEKNGGGGLRGWLSRTPRQKKTPIGRIKGALDRRSEALLRFVSRQMGELVDIASTQLLAMDPEAAHLAYLVERAVEDHGREPVASIVLRRNLLLNGTMLAFIEPVLLGKTNIETDPAVLRRGRETMIALLVEMTLLDTMVVPLEPEWDDDLEAQVAWLDVHCFNGQFDAVRACLLGGPSDEAVQRFLLSSYMLFLQVFLMRTLVRVLEPGQSG